MLDFNGIFRKPYLSAKVYDPDIDLDFDLDLDLTHDLDLYPLSTNVYHFTMIRTQALHDPSEWKLTLAISTYMQGLGFEPQMLQLGWDTLVHHPQGTNQ